MFLWLNFIMHQLLITYNSITITSMYKSVSALHSALDFRLSYSWCQLRFFNNASKKQKKCRKQNPFAILRGRVQKDVSPFTPQKVQKTGKYVISNAAEIKKISYLFVYSGTHRCDTKCHSICVFVLKDITLTTLLFYLFYFFIDVITASIIQNT